MANYGIRNRASHKTASVTSFWSLWYVWLFLVVFICLFAFLSFISVTQQSPIDLANVSSTQVINGRGRWASLSADNYEIVSYVGSDHIRKNNFHYKWIDTDIYLVDVVADSGSKLYSMYISVQEGTLDDENIDLYGQCWMLKDSMPLSAEDDMYIAQAYLLDKGYTVVNYALTVALNFGGLFLLLWLLWILPRQLKKRNAQIVGESYGLS